MSVKIQRGVNVLLGELNAKMTYPDIDSSEIIKERDIRRIAEWGFDHARYLVDAEYLTTNSAPPKMMEIRWEALDKYIKWAKQYNLSIVLSLNSTYGHNANINSGNYAAKNLFAMDLHSIPDTGGKKAAAADIPELFRDEGQQEKFLAFWRYASERYSGENNIAFELLNDIEKDAENRWNKLAYKAIHEIRAKAIDRMIIYGGAGNNYPESLDTIDILDDENVIYPFHFYQPWLLTHEMDTFSKKSMDYYSTYLGNPTHYPGKIGGMSKFINKFPEHHYFEKYNGQFIDSQFLKYIEFAPISEFVNKNPGKTVYCSEFGMIANVGETDAENWIRDVTRLFKESAIPCAFYAYLSPGFSIANAYNFDIYKRHWIDHLLNRESWGE